MYVPKYYEINNDGIYIYFQNVSGMLTWNNIKDIQYYKHIGIAILYSDSRINIIGSNLDTRKLSKYGDNLLMSMSKNDFYNLSKYFYES